MRVRNSLSDIFDIADVMIADGVVVCDNVDGDVYSL